MNPKPDLGFCLMENNLALRKVLKEILKNQKQIKKTLCFILGLNWRKKLS